MNYLIDAGSWMTKENMNALIIIGWILSIVIIMLLFIDVDDYRKSITAQALDSLQISIPAGVISHLAIFCAFDPKQNFSSFKRIFIFCLIFFTPIFTFAFFYFSSWSIKSNSSSSITCHKNGFCYFLFSEHILSQVVSRSAYFESESLSGA